MRHRLLQSSLTTFTAEILYYQEGNAGRCLYVYTVSFIFTWSEIYTQNGSQVPSVATPVQGHGGNDGSVVTYTTTVPVFYHTSCRP